MPKHWAKALLLAALLTSAEAAQVTLLPQPQPGQVVVWVTRDDALTGRAAQPNDSALLNALRHFSEIVPAAVVGATVECRTAQQVTRVQTDRRGRATCPPVTGALQVRAAGQVASLPDFGVAQADHLTISDIDDTLVKTEVRRGGALRVLGQNALTRPIFPQMPALLRTQAAFGPVLYLSNSPQGLTDELSLLLTHHAFPQGPLLLRDWERESGPQHKSAALAVLARATSARFTLIGDDGEQDPELYAAFARAHAGRVERILIRDVMGGERRVEVERLLSGLPWEWLP